MSKVRLVTIRCLKAGQRLQPAVFIVTSIIYSLDVQKAKRVVAVYWSQVPNQRVLFGAQICVVIAGGPVNLNKRTRGSRACEVLLECN